MGKRNRFLGNDQLSAVGYGSFLWFVVQLQWTNGLSPMQNGSNLIVAHKTTNVKTTKWKRFACRSSFDGKWNGLHCVCLCVRARTFFLFVCKQMEHSNRLPKREMPSLFATRNISFWLCIWAFASLLLSSLIPAELALAAARIEIAIRNWCIGNISLDYFAAAIATAAWAFESNRQSYDCALTARPCFCLNCVRVSSVQRNESFIPLQTVAPNILFHWLMDLSPLPSPNISQCIDIECAPSAGADRTKANRRWREVKERQKDGRQKRKRKTRDQNVA